MSAAPTTVSSPSPDGTVPSRPIRLGVIGASGYTGADLIRLAVRHPAIEITGLAAKTQAGQPAETVFPHLRGLGLPPMVNVDAIDTDALDVVVCGLPHATAHEIVMAVPDRVRVIDMSADFRLKDAALYEKWYGPHPAPHLLADAVYGLTEHNRAAVRDARLVACPGCYPTATLLALLPLVKAGLIMLEDIIVDAKSGVTGAGRGAKQATLFSEVGEGCAPYAIGAHRHAPEIEQELARASGTDDVIINFTPHLIPMARGELVTCHVRMVGQTREADLKAALRDAYANEPFVQVLGPTPIPATQHVRGSNTCVINAFEDRIPGRAIVIAALDNLVKGSAGQALQNLNLMFGLDETMGLEQVALFP